MTEIKNLLIENEGLHAENEFLQRQVNALKLRCSELSKRNMELESEVADMKFTRKYLTSEEAGRQFARELLGVPMTDADVAIAKAENCYVPYSGDDF